MSHLPVPVPTSSTICYQILEKIYNDQASFLPLHYLEVVLNEALHQESVRILYAFIISLRGSWKTRIDEIT